MVTEPTDVSETAQVEEQQSEVSESQEYHLEGMKSWKIFFLVYN